MNIVSYEKQHLPPGLLHFTHHVRLRTVPTRTIPSSSLHTTTIPSSARGGNSAGGDQGTGTSPSGGTSTASGGAAKAWYRGCSSGDGSWYGSGGCY
ncbi:hypothetical protein Pcinc_041455 [Petrolisthes cinctipes]|uniref:Uncharacterized protein n=1 Tax=Petrolisthes cinctipes TaxID=88211 RepID=A0AAE1BK53_PETCI|nr:hypothetical protein Pcinc_041455 [Petrolisthes cinctipes]